jgi:ABC-2 type transport system permease protein
MAAYGNQEELLGYQREQMITYLIIVTFLRGFILASRTADIAGKIRSGELTRIMVLPIRMVNYWLGKDFVDKALNLFFTSLEIGLILLIFNFPFSLPQSPLTYLYFALMTILAVTLFFFFSFFLSVTAFWTEEIWATRWLFGVIFLNFFAGAIFPIDILPSWLVKAISFTPFPYLVYYPAKVWLEQLAASEILTAFSVSLFWLLIFFWLTKVLWKKGAKNYGAYGG